MLKVFFFYLLVLINCYSQPILEATWSPFSTISKAASDRPQIAMDAAGNCVAIWRQFDGTNTNIESAILPKDASWFSPITIASTPGNYLQSNPQIAMDEAGNTVAIWEELTDLGSTVVAATLPIGGKWSNPATISEPNTEAPKMVMNSSGLVVAVWQKNGGCVQSATYQFGNSWSTPVDVSTAFIDTSDPQIYVNSKGDALAVWLDVTDQVFQAAFLACGGSWLAPVNISATGVHDEPQIILTSSSSAVAIWQRFNDSNYSIQASLLQDGFWSPPMDISIPCLNAFGPKLAMDQNENIMAVWSQAFGNDIIIQSATLLSGLNVWTAPSNISQTGALAYDPDLKFDSLGNAYIIWDRSKELDVVIQTSTLPVNGNCSQPFDLSFASQITNFPKIAVHSSGYAVAIWMNTTLDVIQAAILNP